MRILKLVLFIIIATFIFNSCTSEVETTEEEIEAVQEENDLFGRQQTLIIYEITYPPNTSQLDKENFRAPYINEGTEHSIGDFRTDVEFWEIYDVFDFSNPSYDKPCPSCVKIKKEIPGGDPTMMHVNINSFIPIMPSH